MDNELFNDLRKKILEMEIKIKFIEATLKNQNELDLKIISKLEKLEKAVNNE